MHRLPGYRSLGRELLPGSYLNKKISGIVAETRLLCGFSVWLARSGPGNHVRFRPFPARGRQVAVRPALAALKKTLSQDQTHVPDDT
jgi:hypothetical protein